MERNEYIKLCQIGAVDNSIKVKYNNIQYFPTAYMMQFDGAGNPVNIAVLRDMNQNTIVYAQIEKVVENDS